MATHSSILAWRIPWTKEPGGLQSTGLQSQTWLKQLGMNACWSAYYEQVTVRGAEDREWRRKSNRRIRRKRRRRWENACLLLASEEVGAGLLGSRQLTVWHHSVGCVLFYKEPQVERVHVYMCVCVCVCVCVCMVSSGTQKKDSGHGMRMHMYV